MKITDYFKPEISSPIPAKSTDFSDFCQEFYCTECRQDLLCTGVEFEEHKRSCGMIACPICCKEGSATQNHQTHINLCLDRVERELNHPKARDDLANVKIPIVIPDSVQTYEHASVFLGENSVPEIDLTVQMFKAKPAKFEPTSKIKTAKAAAIIESISKSSTSPTGKPLKERKKRVCPWYKMIEGTTFSMDAFQFGLIPNCTAYFLSHFHADHYMGLTVKFEGKIYCSSVTANLIMQELRVKREFIHILPFEQSCDVQGVKVTLIDANHCPGAAIFIFQTKTKRILHTGDFRACELHWTHPLIVKPCVIDTLYLDTTYCKSVHSFPLQSDVLDLVGDIIRRICVDSESIQSIVMGTKNLFSIPSFFKKEKTLIVVGTYKIGKEKVFLKAAETLNSKIYGVKDKIKVLKALEDPRIELMLTERPEMANVHVVTMNKLNKEHLTQLLSSSSYDKILAIRPTGWVFRPADTSLLKSIKPVYYSSKITLLPIPYSEHSSYDELKELVTTINVKSIIPTVNVHKYKEMQEIFKSWKE